MFHFFLNQPIRPLDIIPGRGAAGHRVFQSGHTCRDGGDDWVGGGYDPHGERACIEKRMTMTGGRGRLSDLNASSAVVVCPARSSFIFLVFSLTTTVTTMYSHLRCFNSQMALKACLLVALSVVDGMICATHGMRDVEFGKRWPRDHTCSEIGDPRPCENRNLKQLWHMDDHVLNLNRVDVSARPADSSQT